MEETDFEPAGLFPRSIGRTIARFRQQLRSESIALGLQEYRIYRSQARVAVRYLFILLLLPVSLNWAAKTLIITPLVQYFWNTYSTGLFLNAYQAERAFQEMRDFESQLVFEMLLSNAEQDQCSQIEQIFDPTYKVEQLPFACFASCEAKQAKQNNCFCCDQLQSKTSKTKYSAQVFQEKSVLLAEIYNQQSITAISNMLGDLVMITSTVLLLRWNRPQFRILKTFFLECFFSFNDAIKSFYIILVTDFFVGFHSPRGWEIAMEMLLRHLGLPENEEFILLFVGTFPVFLDTGFKYWIFRYLNKISPSTVATYHNMIE